MSLSEFAALPILSSINLHFEPGAQPEISNGGGDTKPVLLASADPIDVSTGQSKEGSSSLLVSSPSYVPVTVMSNVSNQPNTTQYIDNVYNLSTKEIMDFREYLTTKLTMRQLKVVLDFEKGIPKGKACSGNSGGGVIHVKREPQTIRVRRRKSANPYRKKDLIPKSVKRMRNLENAKRRIKASKEADGSVSFKIKLLNFGRFAVVSQSQPTASDSTLTVCLSANLIFYDVHYILGTDRYNCVYSLPLAHIESLASDKTLVSLKLNSLSYVEIATRNDVPCHLSAAHNAAAAAESHVIEFWSIDRVDTFRNALTVAAAENLNKYTLLPYGPQGWSEVPLTNSTMNGNCMPPIMPAVLPEISVPGLWNPYLYPTPPVTPMVTPPLMDMPLADGQFPSSYMQHDFHTNLFRTINDDSMVQLHAMSLHYSTSGYRLADSAQSAFNFIPSPSESPVMSNSTALPPFIETAQQVMSTENLVAVMSDYAHSLCAHESEYACALPSPIIPIESQYYLHSMQGHSFYLPGFVAPGHNWGLSQATENVSTFAMEPDTNSNSLANVPLYDPPVENTMFAPDPDDVSVLWRLGEWGAGANQLSG